MQAGERSDCISSSGKVAMVGAAGSGHEEPGALAKARRSALVFSCSVCAMPPHQHAGNGQQEPWTSLSSVPIYPVYL